MTQTSPETVARKLSDAQRKAMLARDDHYVTTRELRELAAMKLIQIEDKWRVCLTPLGQQVRAALLAEDRS